MYKKILVPLDGSELAEQVLPYVKILGQSAALSVQLLRVIPHKPPAAPVICQSSAGKKLGFAPVVNRLALVRLP
ncbi:MAG: universal stress protein [Chloroflexi bacterium]|nr:universal stress protein [Chloroflexota bacterium]